MSKLKKIAVFCGLFAIFLVILVYFVPFYVGFSILMVEIEAKIFVFTLFLMFIAALVLGVYAFIKKLKK